MNSIHHLTGFWFESGLEAQDDAEHLYASQFLATALHALQSSTGEAMGAIHSNFDPLMLSMSLPGHAWLRDRLRWMKQTFPSFDDAPGDLRKVPEKRRSPFPAFHWSRLFAIEGRLLPLHGVQVLIGHDFAVIHEFRVSLDDEETTLAVPFAPAPPAPLFTALFRQRSGAAGSLQNDWTESEFTLGQCPRVDSKLRVAMRGCTRRYHGRLLVETENTNGYALARAHIDASAYQTFLCTLLVNAAKVEYEFDIAHDVVDVLRERLLSVQVSKSDATGENELSHDATQRVLYHFDQLALTCQLNVEQFEQVSGQLLKSHNTWTRNTRRRMNAYHENLVKAKSSLWKLFNDVEPHLSPPSKARIRDQIFISYAHEDIGWLGELKTQINPYVQKFNAVGLDNSLFWDDSHIKPGDNWREKIKEALARSRAAIFLVSPHFLASKFIVEHEIPELLKAQEKEGLLLCLIHIRFSSYKQTVLEPYQALNNPEKPLQHLRTRRDEEWVRICEKIFEIIGPSGMPASNNQ